VDTVARISDDGRLVAYLSGPFSSQKTMLRDLGAAASKVLAPGWRMGTWITLTGDGGRLIFQGASQGERGIYSLDVNGGVPMNMRGCRKCVPVKVERKL
jgi:hypothetical protein